MAFLQQEHASYVIIFIIVVYMRKGIDLVGAITVENTFDALIYTILGLDFVSCCVFLNVSRS